jgi:hypothetical protein
MPEAITSPVCRSTSLYLPGRICEQAATVPVSTGCIHEHIWRGYLCEEHAGAKLHCPHCYEVDKHPCPVLIKRMPPGTKFRRRGGSR